MNVPRSMEQRQRESHADRAVELAIAAHRRVYGPVLPLPDDSAGVSMLGLDIALGLACSPAAIRQVVRCLTDWADHYERAAAAERPVGTGQDGATVRLHSAESKPAGGA